MNKKSRTLILFYVLTAYIALQFVWWSYLLTNLSREVYTQKEIALTEKTAREGRTAEQPLTEFAELKKKHRARIIMIIGEGTVFLSLLIFGIYRVKKSFEKETQLIRQQKNFMLSVTHELKTPLAAIKLNLQTIQKRDLDKEKIQQLLSTSLRETDRLNQLIENVLLAARMENAELNFLKEKINLSEFLGGIVAGSFDTSRTQTTVDKNIFVSSDKHALQSIISNLIENALKYSDGNVKVNLFLKNNLPHIEIIDTGRGIPPEEKENIFKKFYRGGNEDTRKTKGTGLGLFIVKYLADKNNIAIKLADNSPRGSVFTVIFNDGTAV